MVPQGGNVFQQQIVKVGNVTGGNIAILLKIHLCLNTWSVAVDIATMVDIYMFDFQN
jgi:hypothetical protein